MSQPLPPPPGFQGQPPPWPQAAGPGGPAGPAGPGVPGGPVVPPRKKKSRVGLIVMLVIGVVIVVCGGCGGGVWYFGFGGDEVIAAMNEDDPVYPQQYVPTVAAAPSGGSYGYIKFEGGDDLCKHLDRPRISAVLPVKSAEPSASETKDEAHYGCTLKLSNLDEFPTRGSEGEFTVLVRAYADPADTRAAYDAALKEFTDSRKLPSDGMDVEASAFQAAGFWRLGVFLFATDGNMLISVGYAMETEAGEVPAVPGEVLLGICVDTANEIIPLALKG